MAKKNRKQTEKINGKKKNKRSDRRKDSNKDSGPIRVEAKMMDVGMNRREEEESVFAGLVSGNPSLIQSNFGFIGKLRISGTHDQWRPSPLLA